MFDNLEQFDAAYAELRQRHPKLCVKPSKSVFGLGFSILDEERSSAALLIVLRPVPHRPGRHAARDGRAGPVPHHAADGIPGRP
ncbi:hypothetical protein LP419_16630 [Massilia sp. H-1]|nr:hypothetical protein LP419_16630 [Massilia sp. H-1]